MTNEEAKEFLIDVSYKLGNMSVEYLSEKDGEKMREAVKTLEQEPKTGHWITTIKSDRRDDYWPTNPKCSECGGEPYYCNTIYNYKFCPFCGCRMSEVSI